MGCFDPYSDDPRLGIQKLHLCKYSGYLTVAGTAGQVCSHTGALLFSFIYSYIICDYYIVITSYMTITTYVLNVFYSNNFSNVSFYKEHRQTVEAIVCTY